MLYINVFEIRSPYVAQTGFEPMVFLLSLLSAGIADICYLDCLCVMHLD